MIPWSYALGLSLAALGGGLFLGYRYRLYRIVRHINASYDANLKEVDRIAAQIAREELAKHEQVTRLVVGKDGIYEERRKG